MSEKLTRQEMEAVIDGGGSVIYDGTVFSRKENLPTALELANGDESATKAALEALELQKQAIDQQKAALEETTGKDGSSEPPPDPTAILDENVDTVVAHIETLEDAQALQALFEAEHAGKTRKGVITAIENRLAAIESAE